MSAAEMEHHLMQDDDLRVTGAFAGGGMQQVRPKLQSWRQLPNIASSISIQILPG